MAYIEFDRIQKYFGRNHVLRGVSIGVERGELATLLGPSGCGKSTLLRCLAGLETVSEGRILLDGCDITNLAPQKRAIGMVFQQYSLFPNLTAEQNVAFGLKIAHMPAAHIREKVAQVLDVVGLSDKAKRYPAELSGGQQQRVALARAIVLEPKVLLLDEPLSAIDALLRRQLQTEIRRIQREFGITTVFVTHDQDEAMVMSDTIFLMNIGRVEQSGGPAELYTQPRTGFAARFIGHYNILDAAAFTAITGAPAEAAEIAIRPELVTVSDTEWQGEGYCVRGVVSAAELHGNIVRYTVRCAAASLQADLLFDRAHILPVGAEAYVVIDRAGCLPLDV